MRRIERRIERDAAEVERISVRFGQRHEQGLSRLDFVVQLQIQFELAVGRQRPIHCLTEGDLIWSLHQPDVLAGNEHLHFAAYLGGGREGEIDMRPPLGIERRSLVLLEPNLQEWLGTRSLSSEIARQVVGPLRQRGIAERIGIRRNRRTLSPVRREHREPVGKLALPFVTQADIRIGGGYFGDPRGIDE